MTIRILTDAQWAKIEPLCSGKASERGVTAKDNRLFVEAVLWITQTDTSWRSLPDAFGPWHTVYVRFSRWKKKGIWTRIISSLNDEPGLAEMLTIAALGRGQMPAERTLRNTPALERNSSHHGIAELFAV